MPPPSQKPPLRSDAQDMETKHPATMIFLHGFGDDAEGWINIAQQFHASQKLPHLSWIFPNAPHDHDSNAQAWYPVASFSPIPVGRSSSSTDQPTPGEEDSAEDDDEVEEEIWKSVEYVNGLVDEEVKKGVKLDRIVVGGFSQGCAVSLITGLAGRYKGKLGGVVGLSGYLPQGKRAREGRREFVKEKDAMKVFLAHGTKDMLVPMRMFRDTKARVVRTIGEEALEAHEYEGMGHVASSPEFRDMCAFLENAVPEISE